MQIFQHQKGTQQLFSKKFIIFGIVLLWLCFIFMVLSGSFDKHKLKTNEPKTEQKTIIK